MRKNYKNEYENLVKELAILRDKITNEQNAENNQYYTERESNWNIASGNVHELMRKTESNHSNELSKILNVNLGYLMSLIERNETN